MYKSLLSLVVSVFAISTVFGGSPGQLDPTFGTGGIVTANIGKFSGDTAVAAALQPDGKILIVGGSTSNSEFSPESGTSYLARINTDGTLDKSFGAHGSGFTPLVGSVSGVSIRPDGKIVVVGADTLVTTETFLVFLVMRLNPDGSYDKSFGTNGIVRTPFSDLFGNSRAVSVAVQSDGKVVAAGYATNGLAMLVARYNEDGSLDNGFSTDGREAVMISNGANRANVVMLQSDGKIVLGGSTRAGTTGTITDFALVRLNIDGTLDGSFDSDGKVTTKFGDSSSTILGIDIRSDGTIVAGGNSVAGSIRSFALARYNSDGSPDLTFDADGKVVTHITVHDSVFGVQTQEDGKIVVCGHTVVDPFPFVSAVTVRYNVDGSLDGSYDGDGIAVTAVPDIHSSARAVLIQPDARIVAIGYTGFGGFFGVDTDILLARYQVNGQPDESFGSNGVLLIEFGNSSDMMFEMAPQPDGKVVAAGYSYDSTFQNVTVARFNIDGSLDTGFGSGGSISTMVTDIKGSLADSYANEVIVQPDGKILVSAETYVQGKFVTIRYNSDGSPDNSFGTGGVSTITFSPEGEHAWDMALLPDGKIVIVGVSGISAVEYLMIKLNADGTLDTTFGVDGKLLMSLNGRANVIRAVSIQADGKIVVAGSSQASSVIARYDADGTPDLSFGSNGAAYLSPEGTSGLKELVVQNDGKISAVGGYQNNELSGTILVRLNADGSLDSSFDGDGTVLVSDPGEQDRFSFNKIAVQPNGNIVMPGYFYHRIGESFHQESAIMRFNSNGSRDKSWGNSGTVVMSLGQRESALLGALVMRDGKILAGGFSHNGLNYDFTLVRFQGDRSAKFDFDGDGKSDVAVFRPSVGDWYRLNSSNGAFIAQHFGQDGDRPTPADFDGDGKTDIAVFRPANGGWYVLHSSDGTFSSTALGLAEDLPVTEDYDGDGKADISVYRPSGGVWYRLNSSNGQFVADQFGVAEDKPAIGDFDGDGYADISVYRPSLGNWYRLNSSNGEFVAVNFGIAEDLPTAADYDGDGKADISVYRPSAGTWYRLNSSTSEFIAAQFGVEGDRPAAADFDGDGETDLAVFRPSNANWYFLNTTGGFTALQFGVAEDRPASNAFVY